MSYSITLFKTILRPRSAVVAGLDWHSELLMSLFVTALCSHPFLTMFFFFCLSFRFSPEISETSCISSSRAFNEQLRHLKYSSLRTCGTADSLYRAVNAFYARLCLCVFDIQLYCPDMRMKPGKNRKVMSTRNSYYVRCIITNSQKLMCSFINLNLYFLCKRGVHTSSGSVWSQREKKNWSK